MSYQYQVPADIIRKIADYLADDEARASLASLQSASHLAYELVNPVLYAHLVISAPRCASLLAPFDGADMATSNLPLADATEAADGEFGWAKHPSTRRRLTSLAYVKRVTIRSLPPDYIAQPFADAAAAMASTPSHPVSLMPRVTAVSLLPTALDELRTWSPPYDRPPAQRQLPPFLAALTTACSPRHLCMAFRLVPSQYWKAQEDRTMSGSYAFVNRINNLTAQWTGLDEVRYHDIVHQVPPSVSGRRNVYEFAPHVVPHPYREGRWRFLRGRDAVGISGMDWSLRPWQLAIAIKSLFPSSAQSSHMAALERTSWVFSGLTGHILTQEARNDTDDRGVGWREVDGLVRGSLRVGLARDLPAREGMGVEFVDEVWDKVAFENRLRVCLACRRDVDGDDEYPVDNMYSDLDGSLYDD